jgi:predicted Holliday junction resolvase-like endonuclease
MSGLIIFIVITVCIIILVAIGIVQMMNNFKAMMREVQVEAESFARNTKTTTEQIVRAVPKSAKVQVEAESIARKITQNR